MRALAGGEYAYVLTRGDYVLGGFVDADVEHFSIDSIGEAMDIKKKLEAYAKSKGDDFTEFVIEKLDDAVAFLHPNY